MEHGTTEAELLRAAVLAIRSALPSTWSLSLDQAPGAYVPDGLLTLGAPDGASVLVLLQCKAVPTPRNVETVARQVERYLDMTPHSDMAVGAMLVSRFVSPTTRAQLEKHGLGWFDTTGNMRLRLDRPAVFVDRAGADRSGFRDPEDRLLKSLRGPGAARIVLELCETSLPVGVRDLAARVGVSVSTSARVLGLLNREAVIERTDGVVTSVHKRALVERWTQDYTVMASNEVIATLDPRGLDHALKTLPSVDNRVVVTGSAATRAYLPEGMTPVSPLVSLSLYAEDPIGLMEQLGLRTVERGTNVFVLRAYDHVVHATSRSVADMKVAAPAQVVADLLTGPGRSSEEAEQLLSVLAANDPDWRS
jgi:hypothetical protein